MIARNSDDFDESREITLMNLEVAVVLGHDQDIETKKVEDLELCALGNLEFSRRIGPIGIRGTRVTRVIPQECFRSLAGSFRKVGTQRLSARVLTIRTIDRVGVSTDDQILLDDTQENGLEREELPDTGLSGSHDSSLELCYYTTPTI
jgi:hypothetical protein